MQLTMQTKFLFLVLPILLLAGCASTPEPTIRTVIQRVEIPIPVVCKAEIPEKPDFYFENLSKRDDLFEKVKALLADRELHIGYEGELLTALETCTDETLIPAEEALKEEVTDTPGPAKRFATNTPGDNRPTSNINSQDN